MPRKFRPMASFAFTQPSSASNPSFHFAAATSRAALDADTLLSAGNACRHVALARRPSPLKRFSTPEGYLILTAAPRMAPGAGSHAARADAAAPPHAAA